MKLSGMAVACVAALSLAGCGAPSEDADASARESGNAITDVAGGANALDAAADEAATPVEAAVLDDQANALNVAAEQLPGNDAAPAPQRVIDGRTYELVDG